MINLSFPYWPKREPVKFGYVIQSQNQFFMLSIASFFIIMITKSSLDSLFLNIGILSAIMVLFLGSPENKRQPMIIFDYIGALIGWLFICGCIILIFLLSPPIIYIGSISIITFLGLTYVIPLYL